MNSDKVYDILEAIQFVNEVKLKKQIILHNKDLLKPIFYYAYNPYYRYGFGKLPKKWIGKRLGRIDTDSFKLLELLAAGRLSGNKAKRYVSSHLHSLSYKSSIVFRRVILKDLRCGIGVKVINSCYPGLIPEFGIMKAEDYDESRITFPCFVSPKAHGLRGYKKEGKIFSSGGHPYIGLDHIIIELNQQGIISDIDGELMIPHMSFEESSGLIRNHHPTPNAMFFVFDMPSTTTPFYQRYENLKLACQSTIITRIIEHRIVHSLAEIDKYYDECVAANIEGVVIKTYSHVYQRKRSWDWIKRVSEDTVDVLCTGTYEGEGKYEGRLGGISVEYRGRIVKVGTGFSDSQREIYGKDPWKIIGSVVECVFKERTNLGSMRHSRFIGIRNDK